MRWSQAWKSVLVAVVLLLGAGRPLMAAEGMSESTTIEIKLGDVSFLMHQVCIGEDPRSPGMIRVVTQMELTPGPYANTWVVKFIAEGPSEDDAHAFAALAGISLFYGGEQLKGFLERHGVDGYTINVNRLSVWPGPIVASQALGALRGSFGLYPRDNAGVAAAFENLAKQFSEFEGPLY